MICPKCGSENVNVQVINTVKLKDKHHGLIWWCFFGWYWVPIKWIMFTFPAIIFKIFGHKQQRAINKQQTVCICQSCGNRWNK